MAPFTSNVSNNAIANAVVPVNWSTQLAFLVVLIAGMEGTLGLESADPCRLSFCKFRLLLFLEALEVFFAVISEILAFLALRSSLNTRFEWLKWVAPSLLAIGFLELILEAWHTLSLAARSRVYWQPLSAVGRNEDGKNWTQVFETVAPMFLIILSIYLVGWRQQWWLKAPPVPEAISLQRAKNCVALSVGALGFCFVWGFLLLSITCIGLVFLELFYTIVQPSWGTNETMFNVLRLSFDPSRWAGANGHWLVDPPHSTKDKDVYDMLYKLEYGNLYGDDDYLKSSYLESMDEETKEDALLFSPPHIRNAIVGVFREQIYLHFWKASKADHFILKFSEHFTILPIQICVAVGIYQMHDALDGATREALKELVDAVVVLAVVDIAVALKVAIWGFGHNDFVHNNDRPFGEEKRESTRTPGLQALAFNRLKNHARQRASSSTGSSSTAPLRSG